MNEFTFTAEAWNKQARRLTNQIFKLLPLYEENGDWQNLRETIILDLYGYNTMFAHDTEFMTLVAKLYALDHAETQVVFRKLVFEAISTLAEIKEV